jgi:hypothetical protein
MKLKLRFNRNFNEGEKYESLAAMFTIKGTHIHQGMSRIFFPIENFFLPLTLAIFSILIKKIILGFSYLARKGFSSVDFILLFDHARHNYSNSQSTRHRTKLRTFLLFLFTSIYTNRRCHRILDNYENLDFQHCRHQ